MSQTQAVEQRLKAGSHSDHMDQRGSRKLCAEALGLLFRRVGQDRVGQMTTWTSKVAHLGD